MKVNTGRTNNCFLAKFQALVLKLLVVILSQVFFQSAFARADSELEILKQNHCTFLVSSDAAFKVGDVLQAETSKGKQISLRVTKKKNKNAIVVLSSLNNNCQKISGFLKLKNGTEGSSGLGSALSKEKKLYFGVSANAGLFTFRQPFAPVQVSADQPQTDTQEQPQTISGLSGVGFSGVGMIRYVPKSPLGIELGLGFISASPTGQTKISNNDDYTVTTRFTELTVLPALTFSQCLISRLFCKVGGVVAFPLGSKIFIKSLDVDQAAKLQYLRFGGEFAAGMNIGPAFTIVGGTQLTLINGGFKFESESEAVKLEKSLTVYIYGGVSTAF